MLPILPNVMFLLASNVFATTLPVLVTGTYVGDDGCIVTVTEAPQSLQVRVIADVTNGAFAWFPPSQISLNNDSLTGFRNASDHEEILNLTFDTSGSVLTANVTDKNFSQTLTQSCTGLKLQSDGPPDCTDIGSPLQCNNTPGCQWISHPDYGVGCWPQ